MGKVCLRCFQKFVDNAFAPQANFPVHIWIFNGGEGDGIESRLPFKIFSTLPGTVDVTILILDSRDSFRWGRGAELSVLVGVSFLFGDEASEVVEKAAETFFCTAETSLCSASSRKRLLATAHLMIEIL
jgi:hypothetical protein